VRVAAWIFVVCAVAAAIGMFLPALEVRVGGNPLAKRTSLSIYRANTNSEFIRRLVAGYKASSGKKLGTAVAAELMPRVGGKLHGAIDDASSAMTSLDDVSDSDAKTLARVLAISLWTFIALHVAMALVVGADLVRDRFRRSRLIAALAMAVVSAAAGIAIHVGCSMAIAEANDDLGKDLIGYGAGAWLIPIAAIGGLGAAIALLVIHRRAGHTAATSG